MILVARKGSSAEDVKAGQVIRQVPVNSQFICNDLSCLSAKNSCCFLLHILSHNEAAEKGLLSLQVSLVEKIFDVTTNREGGPQK